MGNAYNATVSDCVNYGSVSMISYHGDNSVSGIVGSSDNAIMTNCANFGSISIGYGSCDGIFGKGYGTATNCISFGTVEDTAKAYFVNSDAVSENVTVEQLNSKSFYTDPLGWTEQVWNLDNLDFANGKYPTLK